MRLQRVRIDDRRHGVGRVMKTIDEFEAQRDQQCHRQQHVGPDADQRDIAHVVDNVESAIPQTAKHDSRKDDSAQQAGTLFHFFIEQRFPCYRICYACHALSP